MFRNPKIIENSVLVFLRKVIEPHVKNAILNHVLQPLLVFMIEGAFYRLFLGRTFLKLLNHITPEFFLDRRFHRQDLVVFELIMVKVEKLKIY